jgi:hypothetical protein
MTDRRLSPQELVEEARSAIRPTSRYRWRGVTKAQLRSAALTIANVYGQMTQQARRREAADQRPAERSPGAEGQATARSASRRNDTSAETGAPIRSSTPAPPESARSDARMVGAYSGTEPSRSVLILEKDAGHPLLGAFIEHARMVAAALIDVSRFLEGDSIPADPAQIRQYMMEEMNALWLIRRGLLDDLRLYSNESIVTALPQKGVTSEVIIDELDSIRSAVKQSLGNKIRAALDDLSNEQVSSAQRIESREAAIHSVNVLAEKWVDFSHHLSLIEIEHRHDSA